MKITIDKEFSRLMPPLTDAEYGQLEENIARDGCLAPLPLWRGILLDLHNCYEICQKHKIKFKTVDIELSSRAEATIWIIRKHLGRRNLADFQKIELVDHLEKVYAEEAKKKQLSTLKRGNKSPALPALAERTAINTRKEMARLAGVSTGQYYKGKEIIAKATEAEKEALRHGGNGTTINKVHADIRQRARKAAALKLAKDRRRDKSFIESEKIDLRCGDCVKILPTIKDSSVDFVLIDPPYNVGLKYNSYDDNMPDEDYYLWCKKWLTECCRVLKDRHFGVVFTSDSKSGYVHRAVDESGLTFHHFIKWFKPGAQGSLPGSNLFYRTELAFLVSKGKPDISLINRKEFYQDTVILNNTTPNQVDAVDHPARRPIELYKKIVDGFTQEDDTVLDPMAGSGSCGMATKELGRRYIGIEIDEYYFNIAQERINSAMEGGSLEDLLRAEEAQSPVEVFG